MYFDHRSIFLCLTLVWELKNDKFSAKYLFCFRLRYQLNVQRLYGTELKGQFNQCNYLRIPFHYIAIFVWSIKFKWLKSPHCSASRMQVLTSSKWDLIITVSRNIQITFMKLLFFEIYYVVLKNKVVAIKILQLFWKFMLIKLYIN